MILSGLKNLGLQNFKGKKDFSKMRNQSLNLFKVKNLDFLNQFENVMLNYFFSLSEINTYIQLPPN